MWTSLNIPTCIRKCIRVSTRTWPVWALSLICLPLWAEENIPQVDYPFASPSGSRGVSPIEYPRANIGRRTGAANYKPALLEVEINGEKLNQTSLVLQDASGIYYFWVQDLIAWRFAEPPLNSSIDYEGQTYYPSTALSAQSLVVDTNKGTLTLQSKASAFTLTTRSTAYAKLPPPTRSQPGGFFNYDLFTSNSAGLSQHSGLFELGAFNRLGVGTSNVLVQNSDNTSNPGTKATRLDTTWTIDKPESIETLRIGDAISSPGTWGRSVRIAGVQFATNFNTRPGFITYPMRTARGQAVLPSTVDVFVNNALVSRQNVPPGPFDITNLPVISGAGEVNLVVRDLFGRQQLITQPFYSSQALLKTDLSAFSYELGLVRNNYGIDSNNYSNWVASENYRRGINDNLTAEVHSEVTSDNLTSGVGADYLIPLLGTLSTYVAGSRGKINVGNITGQGNQFAQYIPTTNATTDVPLNAGDAPVHTATANGGLLLVGMDRVAPPWGMAIRSQWASSGFTQVGQQTAQSSPADITIANLSYTTKSSGSFNVSFINQVNRDIASNRLLTLGYGLSLGQIGSISITALKDYLNNGEITIFCMYSVPLGKTTTASVSAQSQRGGSAGGTNNFTSTLQRSVPSAAGYGYSLQARSNGANLGSYTQQTEFGNYTASVAQQSGFSSTSFDVNGGVAALGSEVFMSRRIDQSFGVATIPDYPDVTILADNQPVAKTNKDGVALVPRLRAYDRNIISIEPVDIPLDATIQGVKVEAVPYYRSGIAVKFPIERSNSATFTLKLEDGDDVPLGASILMDGKKDVFSVGEGGWVYVANLGPLSKLHATWQDQRCNFEIKFAPSNDPLPDLGTVICKGWEK